MCNLPWRLEDFHNRWPSKDFSAARIFFYISSSPRPLPPTHPPTHPHEHSMVKSTPLQFGVVGGMGVKKTFVWLHSFAETCTWDAVLWFSHQVHVSHVSEIAKRGLVKVRVSGGWWPWTLFRDIGFSFLCGSHCRKGRIYEKPYSTSLFNFLSSMAVLIKFHV